MSERHFPILHPVQGTATSVPWAVVAPHEAQALRNHYGQTLDRLAERGGLDVVELWCVVHDKAWSDASPLEVCQGWLDGLAVGGAPHE